MIFCPYRSLRSGLFGGNEAMCVAINGLMAGLGFVSCDCCRGGVVELLAMAAVPDKKKMHRFGCILLLLSRYLAESNCSTRFCRPLPNRSAKVPFCLRMQR